MIADPAVETSVNVNEVLCGDKEYHLLIELQMKFLLKKLLPTNIFMLYWIVVGKNLRKKDSNCFKNLLNKYQKKLNPPPEKESTPFKQKISSQILSKTIKITWK